MNEQLSEAKARYREAEVPMELESVVGKGIAEGERRRRHSVVRRRGIATMLSACACFMLLVNLNSGFAAAVSEVPLLGKLARIITVAEYKIDDRSHLIEVRLPAIADTGNSELEGRVNREIEARIEGVLAEAEARAREARVAYVATGGEESEFIPIMIEVDYEIKCNNGKYLSFVIMKTETIASAYTEVYVYNIDIGTGKEVSMEEVLGSAYESRVNEAVVAGIEERSKEEGNAYFDGSEGVAGFSGIGAGQKFYINERGNVVVVFEKYEIAPGYMGIQEFEVPTP